MASTKSSAKRMVAASFPLVDFVRLYLVAEAIERGELHGWFTVLFVSRMLPKGTTARLHQELHALEVWNRL